MRNTRKVLMLVENLPVPADPRVWMEATSLRDAGYQVSVICPKGSTSCCESYICIDSIHVYRYWLPEISLKFLAHIIEYSFALCTTFLLSFKVLFRHGFDVIHAANPPDLFFLIALFYRGFGKKFVFDQHDLAPEMFSVLFGRRVGFLYRLLRLLERCSYRYAHLVITANETFRQLAIKRGRCGPEKVVVIRNGPDLERFRAIEPAALSLPQQRRYVLAYIGVMGKQDGVEYILYAVDHLVHQRGRQDVAAVLIGEGPALQTLREQVRELHLEDYIHFTGWLEKTQALRYLAGADIGLQPDPQNGLNEYCTMIKAMEYMALGLPIVAFDLAETRFSAQDAALYAQPNEPVDFAGKIEVLLEDADLRRKMGAAGRRRVEEVLNWERSQQLLLSAYENLFAPSMLKKTDEAAIVTEQAYAEVVSSTSPE